MELLISAGAAVAVAGFAHLAAPLIKHWLTVERFQGRARSMTLAVLGKNGDRVVVTLRTGPSGRFEEPELRKITNILLEAHRGGPIAATEA